MSSDSNMIIDDIDNVVIKKPTGLRKLVSSDYVTVDRSQVKNITGYDKCNLKIDDSNIGNLKTFKKIVLIPDSTVNNVKNTQYAVLWGCWEPNPASKPPVCHNLEVDYVEASDLSKIDSVRAHAAYFTSGAEIDRAIVNKLIITRVITEFKSDCFKEQPVIINTAEVTKENFTALDNNNNKLSGLWTRLNISKQKNGYADIEFCKINNLKCELLNAKDAKLQNVDSKKCNNITKCEIDTLKTSEIDNISGSAINKLIITSNTFKMPENIEKQVKSIEFEKPDGILKVKNNGNSLPNINLKNGKIYYELRDFKTDNLEIPANLDANENVQINNLTVTDPNAVVTITGNSKIKNINFKNGGKVILKNDADGKHTNASTINIINGEIVKDYPIKGFEKVAGMDELKQQLHEDVIEPLENPERYQKYGLDVINGFLMYGPPGCGKTFIANQLAEETGRYFVQITPSNTSSSYQHATARAIARKFNEAQANTPSVIFIDEIEALAPLRAGLGSEASDVDINEQVTELLQQLNNCKDKNILVICASNEPQRIDNAIKRTGRLDKKIFVSNPDKTTRQELFKQQLQNIYTEEDINMDMLAQNSEYYTAEDIRMVIRNAAIKAMKDDRPISQDDLLSALKDIKPSLSKSLINEYYMKGEIE